MLPGTTHIQPAQPVLFAHHLLAYVEMAERDRGRLADARRRLNVSPLGAGALAGAGYPLDREVTATELGFDGVTANSLDAVSDRDFVVEVLAAVALGMVHLSRLAEELTWWSNPRFGFVRASDAFSTGSSIMPNKKNPDPAELVRGRAARTIAALTAVLTILKGLPLAYQRDLQEDKPPLFGAVGIYEASLGVLAGMLDTLAVDRDAHAGGRSRRLHDRNVGRGHARPPGRPVPSGSSHRRHAGRRTPRPRGSGSRRSTMTRSRRHLRPATPRRPGSLPATPRSGRPSGPQPTSTPRLRAATSSAGRRRTASMRPSERRAPASTPRAEPPAVPSANLYRRAAMPTLETIRQAPKALLHDHLDGGLRPATIVDLAREYGYADLPTTDADELAAWMRRGADRKSLELYLETFAHTVGVMQERDAIIRVAAECAEDLAADGIVYAEVRYAPELSVERGLTLDEVVEANLEGFRIGAERAAAAGRPIVMKVLVTAMRQFARSLEVAECAVRWRDAGVVGFDIAGPEAGYRPTRYLEAFDYVRRENFHITIHAGESFGPPSIWEALQFCGAERLGHGVRIVDDITLRPDGSVELGRLATFVRDRRVPLEMCPTSNVHTGAVQSVADHPFDLLRRLRYRVTVNTDNRLMSGVSLSSEFAALDEAFGIGLGEMEWLTINAMKSAFAPFDERLRIINEIVKPRYAHLRASETQVVSAAPVERAAYERGAVPGHRRAGLRRRMDGPRAGARRDAGRRLRPRAQRPPAGPDPRSRRAGARHARRRRHHGPPGARARARRARDHERHPPRRPAGPVLPCRSTARCCGQRRRHRQRLRGRLAGAG